MISAITVVMMARLGVSFSWLSTWFYGCHDQASRLLWVVGIAAGACRLENCEFTTPGAHALERTAWTLK